MAAEQLIAYAARIRELLRANPNTPETGLAPAFQQLVTDLLPILPTGPGVTVSPEYTKENTGRPDIALIRAGQLPRAFIELKLPRKNLEPTLWRDAHDKRQFERFRELPVWALCNFERIRFFVRERAESELVIVPAATLLPETSDSKAEQLIGEHDAAPLLDLVNRLAQAQPPSPSNAAQLAEFLAHAARLVRASVVERLNELGMRARKDVRSKMSARNSGMCSTHIPRRAVTVESLTRSFRQRSPRRSPSDCCWYAKRRESPSTPRAGK